MVLERSIGGRSANAPDVRAVPGREDHWHHRHEEPPVDPLNEDATNLLFGWEKTETTRELIIAAIKLGIEIGKQSK